MYSYLSAVVHLMKGRITCPKCKNEFFLDLPEKDKHEVVCPKCDNKFSIQKCDDSETFEECSWEEHGEPRKTVLSSIAYLSKESLELSCPKVIALIIITPIIIETMMPAPLYCIKQESQLLLLY